MNRSHETWSMSSMRILQSIAFDSTFAPAIPMALVLLPYCVA